MPRTLFNTPVLLPALRALARAWLRAAGWRTEGSLPAHAAKCVLVAAPHTSNWDLPYALSLALGLQLHLAWMGKASLFQAPFGGLMRWLGGLPVDRSKSHNAVDSAARALREASGPLQLAIAPEGTRGRVQEWKTGFYFIAQQAGVPIVLAYVDYGRKVGGLGPVFTPTGDVQRDIAEIRRFYAGVQGRNPQQFDGG